MPEKPAYDFEHQQDMQPGSSALKVDPASAAKPDASRARPTPRRRQLSVDDYVQGVLENNRAILARAITLIESNNLAHQRLAQEVLTHVMPRTGKAKRIGITGVPGVGKSTFIETFGSNLTKAGHRVAVLAVDPSSGRTGGSILGDKTRMVQLSTDPNAFIRPSPSAGTLGGVASKTRETMLLCEAAGFDVVLIETVGVGQSETVVAEMTDFFLCLMLAGAGDELQGIKRGVLELADMIAVNKAEGDNADRAKRAAADYRNALHYMHPSPDGYHPPVLTCSALSNLGLDEIWQKISARVQQLADSGELQTQRHEQMLKWMWTMVDDQLRQMLKHHPQVKSIWDRVEKSVFDGRVPPTAGARQILDAFAGGEQRPT